MNKAFLSGRLAAEPELRYTQSGKTVCQLRLAVDDGFGENKKTVFVPVVVWDKQADSCANYLTKGQAAIVEGRIQVRQYEAKDGTKRTATEVVAQRVEFGAKPRGTQGSDTPQGSTRREESAEQMGWQFRGEDVPDEEIPF